RKPSRQAPQKNLVSPAGTPCWLLVARMSWLLRPLFRCLGGAAAAGFSPWSPASSAAAEVASDQARQPLTEAPPITALAAAEGLLKRRPSGRTKASVPFSACSTVQ